VARRTTNIRAPKAAELLADALRREIVLGQIEEGEPLSAESSLMETFGVSRPTLREAIRVLENEGLIEIHRGAHGGARVRRPSEDLVARYAGLVLEYRHTTIADVSAARALLEPPCAAAVARRSDQETIRALRAAIDAAEALADDPRAQLDAQQHFHVLLVERAANGTIALLHGAIQRILGAAEHRSAAMSPGHGDHALHADALRDGARAHRRFVELLEDGDAEGAEKLWRHHIEATTDYIIEAGGATTVLDLI
jgi:DNA-binding FadR family transcriptional regulator